MKPRTYSISRCKATTRYGSQCSNGALPDNNGYCHLHPRAADVPSRAETKQADRLERAKRAHEERRA